jgi:FkbM family methyltransferase
MNLSEEDKVYIVNQKLELNYLLSFHGKAKSQLSQDVFVLSELGFKRGGFFVEFGATDGVKYSNTHVLEKEFGWSGILSEPARVWRNDLLKNRSCYIDFNCVWKRSGDVLEFNEVQDSELSTIDQFSGMDEHVEARKVGIKYLVPTVSLKDLLDRYHAPKVIDYLSIDTEGSEYEILSAFDFDAYQFRVITCEHNYTPMRDKIHDLLTSKGYVRKFTYMSLLDDWYVKE